jgi:hypothetical protein
MMGLASTWDNAKRLCKLESGEVWIEWDSETPDFGVVIGEGQSTRKYRLDFYRIGTRADDRFPDGY